MVATSCKLRHIAQRHRLGGQQMQRTARQARRSWRQRWHIVALQASDRRECRSLSIDWGVAAQALPELAHSAGVKVFIDRAWTSSLCIWSPSVA